MPAAGRIKVACPHSRCASTGWVGMDAIGGAPPREDMPTRPGRKRPRREDMPPRKRCVLIYGALL